MTATDSLIGSDINAHAFRKAILCLLGYRRVNDAEILACLDWAKTGLSFNGMMNELIEPSFRLSNAANPGHWARRALLRLKKDGWITCKRDGKRDLWSITTSGRVMIHRLNQEALRILSERD